MDILKYGVICFEATTGKEVIKSSFYFCSVVSVFTGEHVCILHREVREDCLGMSVLVLVT